MLTFLCSGVRVRRLLPLVLILYTIPNIAVSSQSTTTDEELRFLNFVALESSEITGHSFWEDQYRPAQGDAEMLLVVPWKQRDQFVSLFQSPALQENVAILIPAPRRDPAATVALIQELPISMRNMATVFLDTTGSPRWYAAVPHTVTPVWLVEMVLRHSEIPVATTELSASRLGFGREDAQMFHALSAGLSAIRLEGAVSPEVLPDLLRVVKYQQTQERTTRSHSVNYMIVPGRNNVLIPEPILVAQYIVLTAILLAYSLFRPAKLRQFRRALGYNISAIVISFSFLFASLLVGNLVIRLIQHVLPPETSVLLLMSGKASLAMLTLGILAITVQRNTRRVAAVFSGAAVVLLFLGALTIASISIVIGMYLTVSFVFAILFSLSRSSMLKGLWFVLSLTPLGYLLGTLALLNDLPMIEQLLTPQLYLEVITAIILLPSLLMLFRLDSLTPRIPLVPIMTMFATVGVALVAAFVINILEAEPRSQVTLYQRYIVDSGNLIHGTVGVSDATAGGTSRPYALHIPQYGTVTCSVLPCYDDFSFTPEVDDPPLLSGRVEITSVLDRHTISWTVTALQELEDVQIRFTLPNEVQLYASDVPTRQPMGHQGTVFQLDNGPAPPREFGGSIVFRTPVTPELVDTHITARVHQSTTEISPAPDVLLHTEEWNLTIGEVPQ